MPLHPGETVRYVITATKDKVKDWRTKPVALIDGPLEYDVGKYLDLLDHAANEILDGIAPVPIEKPAKKRSRAATIQEEKLPLMWA